MSEKSAALLARLEARAAAMRVLLHPLGTPPVLPALKVGDTVIRVMPGGREMPMVVSALDDEFIHCGPWLFERASGVEYDAALHWGTRWGVTGTFLKSAP